MPVKLLFSQTTQLLSKGAVIHFPPLGCQLHWKMQPWHATKVREAYTGRALKKTEQTLLRPPRLFTVSAAKGYEEEMHFFPYMLHRKQGTELCHLGLVSFRLSYTR